MAERTATNPFGGSITTLFAKSDWSNTQTITIPETSPAPTASPTSTPTQNQGPNSSSPIAQNSTASPTQTNTQNAFQLEVYQIAVTVLAGLVVTLIIIVVILMRSRGSSKLQ